MVNPRHQTPQGQAMVTSTITYQMKICDYNEGHICPIVTGDKDSRCLALIKALICSSVFGVKIWCITTRASMFVFR